MIFKWYTSEHNHYETEVQKSLKTLWKPLLYAAVSAVAIYLLLFWQLSSLTPGLSSIEVETIKNASSMANILNNPLFLPFLIPLWLLQKIGLDSIFAFRAVASFFGLISIGLFYLLLRQWQTPRIALLGTTLFASSSWFLHNSRIAAPYIMFVVAILFLAVCLFWIRYKARRKIVGLTTFVGLALCLYVPGFIWFLFAIIIWRRKNLLKLFKVLSIWLSIVLIVLGLIVISPIMYATIQNPQFLLNILAIPTSLEPIDWLMRLMVLPAFIFARGPEDPIINLARLPLIDLFTTGLLIVGIYSFYIRKTLLRTKFIAVVTVIATLLVALNGPPFLAILLPVVYIVAISGLTLLLQQWFTVFPSNPIARGFGVFIIIIAISLTSYYHINRYFIAWSKSPETVQVFNQSLPE